MLNYFCRRKQDEVEVLEETIRQRNEQHKKAGVELEATCHICLKTKFADGVGHVCNYCSIRCCARCGGKVTLRSNKVNLKFFIQNFQKNFERKQIFVGIEQIFPNLGYLFYCVFFFLFFLSITR